MHAVAMETVIEKRAERNAFAMQVLMALPAKQVRQNRMTSRHE